MVAAYAGRAGTEEAEYAKDVLDTVAWYEANSLAGSDPTEAGTRPVKTRRRNLWGLYDMLGNVWELCEGGGLRGGSFASPAPDVQFGATALGAPREQIGLRVALSLEL